MDEEEQRLAWEHHVADLNGERACRCPKVAAHATAALLIGAAITDEFHLFEHLFCIAETMACPGRLLDDIIEAGTQVFPDPPHEFSAGWVTWRWHTDATMWSAEIAADLDAKVLEQGQGRDGVEEMPRVFRRNIQTMAAWLNGDRVMVRSLELAQPPPYVLSGTFTLATHVASIAEEVQAPADDE